MTDNLVKQQISNSATSLYLAFWGTAKLLSLVTVPSYSRAVPKAPSSSPSPTSVVLSFGSLFSTTAATEGKEAEGFIKLYILFHLLSFCVARWGWGTCMAHLWTTLQTPCSPSTFVWTLGIGLRSSGLCGKYFQPLRRLVGPSPGF